MYLSIIDNETKDTNKKHIKYNKGLVGQNKSIILLHVNGTYVITKNQCYTTRQEGTNDTEYSTVLAEQKWYNITVNKKRLNKKYALKTKM